MIFTTILNKQSEKKLTIAFFVDNIRKYKVIHFFYGCLKMGNVETIKATIKILGKEKDYKGFIYKRPNNKYFARVYIDGGILETFDYKTQRSVIRKLKNIGFYNIRFLMGG